MQRATFEEAGKEGVIATVTDLRTRERLKLGDAALNRMVEGKDFRKAFLLESRSSPPYLHDFLYGFKCLAEDIFAAGTITRKGVALFLAHRNNNLAGFTPLQVAAADRIDLAEEVSRLYAGDRRTASQEFKEAVELVTPELVAQYGEPS